MLYYFMSDSFSILKINILLSGYYELNSRAQIPYLKYITEFDIFLYFYFDIM